MKLSEILAPVTEINIDNQKGWGEVPDNSNVDYLGLRVKVRPSVFIRLASALAGEVSSDIRAHIQKGGSIAAPFLDIKIPDAWFNGDLTSDARVTSHEGRNRMSAVLELEGDAPVETHLFFRGGIRNRDITPQIVNRLQRSIISQRGQIIHGPWFDALTTHTPGVKLEANGDHDLQPLPKVYVDMDGVLADLFNHVADLHDVEHYNDMSKPQWEAFLQGTDAYHLFSSLPPFPTANALLKMVTDIWGGYRILSSPLGYDPEGSMAGKRDWLKQHIMVPAEGWIFDHDKFKYARQPDGTPNILIDDWNKNILPWNQHGGIGIKYQADEDNLAGLHRKLLEIKASFQ